jgi:hypothetical protein
MNRQGEARHRKSWDSKSHEQRQQKQENTELKQAVSLAIHAKRIAQ